jgi:Phosphodiester glycosidase
MGDLYRFSTEGPEAHSRYSGEISASPGECLKGTAMTAQTNTSTRATMKPTRRRQLIRRRLTQAAVVSLALTSQVLPQPWASAVASPEASALSARIAVEKASLSTLTARGSLNAAQSLTGASHRREVALHRIVLRTRAALKKAPARARPAIRRALTLQTASWKVWVQETRRRNNLAARASRLNAAAEADFKAKSANALRTSYAVPAPAHCRPAANPYAGATRRLVVNYPGLNVTQYSRPGRTPMWVTSANLKAPGATMTTGPLTAPAVTSRSQLAKQITGSGALAGVNADFYYNSPRDTDNSPWGAVVKRGGQVIKSTTEVGRKTFVVQANGLARIDHVKVRPVLRHGRNYVRGDSLNSHFIPVNGIAVFTTQWGKASRGNLRPTQAVREFIVDYRGVITAIRPRVSNTAIPTRGLVIVAQGSAVQRLRAAGFAGGARVQQTSSATTVAGGNVYSAVGVGMQVLRNGLNVTCAHDRPVARTAVGVKPGGREIVLVTVRGQTDSAKDRFTGMSVREMAVFMRTLGVYNAAMFDGGGSTIAMAKVGGKYQQFLGAPHYIRPVSNSLGIWRS